MSNNRMKGVMVIAPRKKQKKSQRGDARRSGPVFPHPPPITCYGIKVSKKLRWVSLNAQTIKAITYQNLLDVYSFAATATTGFNLFQSVRVKEINLYDMPGSTGGTSSVSVLWYENDGNLTGERNVATDTGYGIIPAHVKSRPAKDSLSSKWHLSNTTVCFFISVGVNTVIDLDVEFVQNITGGLTACQNALATATAGQIFQRGLDGLPIASTNYQSGGPGSGIEQW